MVEGNEWRYSLSLSYFQAGRQRRHLGREGSSPPSLFLTHTFLLRQFSPLDPGSTMKIDYVLIQYMYTAHSTKFLRNSIVKSRKNTYAAVFLVPRRVQEQC